MLLTVVEVCRCFVVSLAIHMCGTVLSIPHTPSGCYGDQTCQDYQMFYFSLNFAYTIMHSNTITLFYLVVALSIVMVRELDRLIALS